MTDHEQSTEDSRIGALYRRSTREEPSAEVDRAVLEAARAALPRRRYRTPVPWAIAATLVLGVGIGWQVLQFSQVQVHPASVPADEVDAEIPGQAAVPSPFPESTDAAARTGAPANAAPQLMRREAMPVKKAPLQVDRPVRYSTIEPAAAARHRPGECERYELADDASSKAWREAIEAARKAGDMVQVRCLEQQLSRLEGAAAKPAGGSGSMEGE